MMIIFIILQKISVGNFNKYYGSSKSNICTSYISPYVPVYNNKSVIKACQLPNKTEDKDSPKATIKIETDKIEKIECDPGYYLPSDNERECKKCSITNCNICSGTTNKDIYNSCLINFFENINKGIIISCDKKCSTGSKEKCKSCDKTKNICSSCYQGYYLPTDASDKKVCKQCSISHYQTCCGSTENEICNSCYSSYFENKDFKLLNNLSPLLKS